ncbi:hypothetical protein EUTSA_v10002332mg, partial [Eutrema salsugineum]
NPQKSNLKLKTEKSLNNPANLNHPPPPPPPPLHLPLPSSTSSTLNTKTHLPNPTESASLPLETNPPWKSKSSSVSSPQLLISVSPLSLTPFHLKTLHQRNLFFDTPKNDLSLRRAVLRLRYLQNARSRFHLRRVVVSLIKAKPTLAMRLAGWKEDEQEFDAGISSRN